VLQIIYYSERGKYFCRINQKQLMSTSLNSQQDPRTAPGTGSIKQPEKFIPTGATAFFVALILLCLVIWFGIYFLMIGRI
jgi:hypothetical protein